MTRPLPLIPGSAIMRETYYNQDNLRRAAEWARDRLATGKCDGWSTSYLRAEIKAIEMALAKVRAR